MQWYCSYSSLILHSCTFAWIWRNQCFFAKMSCRCADVVSFFSCHLYLVLPWSPDISNKNSDWLWPLLRLGSLFQLLHSSDAALPSWEHWLSYSHLQRMTKMCLSISHSLSHLSFCLPSVQMPLWQHGYYTKSSGGRSPFCAESSLLQALLIMDSVYLNLNKNI